MRRTVFDHSILCVETFPDPTGAGSGDYVRLRMPDWVNAVAVTPDERLVLVRQHRWGTGRPSLEIPGGQIDGSEDPLQAAMREMLEETGYGGGEWRSLGFVHPNPAIQDNRTWLYAARDVVPLAPPHPDPGESIEIELVPVSQLATLLRAGEITHALAVVTLQRLLLGW